MGLGQSKIDKTLNKGMKKTIKFMKLLSLIIATLITFSSCERTVFDQENELVGSWIGKVTFSGNDYDTFPIMERIETICFFEEEAGVTKFLLDIEDENEDGVFDGYGYEVWEHESFIYTIGEKQFNVLGEVIIIEKVDKETLVLSCNGVKKEFKRKK